MNAPIFELYGRTALQLPVGLFIEENLIRVVLSRRQVDGYNVKFDDDLARLISSSSLENKSICLSDMDMPTSQPLVFQKKTGWTSRVNPEEFKQNPEFQIALAAFQNRKLTVSASVSNLIPALLCCGFDLSSLVDVFYLEYLDRPSDPQSASAIAGQLSGDSSQIGLALFSFLSSQEFMSHGPSIIKKRGATFERLLKIVARFNTPIYKISQLPVSNSTVAEFLFLSGWWDPEHVDDSVHRWMGHSSMIKLNPRANGIYKIRANRSSFDHGIPLSSCKLMTGTGAEIVGLNDCISDLERYLEIIIEVKSSEPIVFQLVASAEFQPEKNDERYLSICFNDFNFTYEKQI